MSSTPARPCTTTALLWQNSLWWISTPSATCLSTGSSFRLRFTTACRDRSTWRWQIANNMGEAYEPPSGCPINATIEVFGHRWSLLVLRDIVFGDRRYFRELQAGSQEGSPQIFSPTDSSDSSNWDCSPVRTREPASGHATA